MNGKPNKTHAILLRYTKEKPNPHCKKPNQYARQPPNKKKLETAAGRENKSQKKPHPPKICMIFKKFQQVKWKPQMIKIIILLITLAIVIWKYQIFSCENIGLW